MIPRRRNVESCTPIITHADRRDILRSRYRTRQAASRRPSPIAATNAIMLCLPAAARAAPCTAMQLSFLGQAWYTVRNYSLPRLKTFLFKYCCATECWGDFNSKQLSCQKFHQNPFLGCLCRSSADSQ